MAGSLVKFKGDFNVVLKRVTPLEALDVSMDLEDSDSFNYAVEVAYWVEDWNGEGTVDPLVLLADKKNHLKIYQLVQLIDKLKDTPALTILESDDGYYCENKEEKFSVILAPLTILQYVDLTSDVRKEKSSSVRSIFKAKLISSIVLDWNNLGKITYQELLDNRELHKWVIAIDRALTEFFRSDEDFTVSNFEGVLDSSDNNGSNEHPEPSSVESSDSSGKQFSVSLERV